MKRDTCQCLWPRCSCCQRRVWRWRPCRRRCDVCVWRWVDRRSSKMSEGPAPKDIEAVFARLRNSPSNKVSLKSRRRPYPELVSPTVNVIIAYARRPASTAALEIRHGLPWRSASSSAWTARRCTAVWACTSLLWGPLNSTPTGRGLRCATCS